MQVVAKKHRIDFKGQVPDSIVKYIIRKFGKKNVTVIDDDYVDYFETDFHKKMEAERTPGKTLRLYRQRDGLTQKELADKLGIYTQHVCNMEKGSRTITVDMAKTLAELFDSDYKMFL
jgi:DNA-binding XRE family transcriptional regulator